ncbi:MAG: YicC family protein [Clostridiales bacterium]|nr:YicC family protein [Clostridiales bacterium]
MKSMTGYGKATVTRDNRELTIELKSVNHRFLDISTKIPRAFIAHEDVIRNGLSKGLSRGHIDVFLNYTLVGDTDKTVQVDMALAKGYVESAKQLKDAFPDLHMDFNVNALMRSNEVLTLKQTEEDSEVLREMVAEAVDKAVENLNAMREVEGNALRKDLLAKIDKVEQLLSQVKMYAPEVAEQYREKLRTRVTEALQGVDIDENKLVNEVCFFVDKSCIDEEITRLTSHIQRAREILRDEQPVGRKLDFLVQEFNRETNTICSKSSFLALTNVALEMKNEIEKIREQVQNLE